MIDIVLSTWLSDHAFEDICRGFQFEPSVPNLVLHLYTVFYDGVLEFSLRDLGFILVASRSTFH